MQGALGYQDSALWKRTLATELDDTGPDGPARRALRSAFEQFRDQVEPLAKDISNSVPGYTDHSISHCDALWDTASLLIGDGFDINPAEAFVLGGAFLVHDLGMGIQAYNQGLAGIVDKIQWRDLLASLHPKDHHQIQRSILSDIERNPNWDGLTDVRAKDALTLYLRFNHAEQAESIIKQEWKLSNKQSFYLIADNRLRLWYGDSIGKIARSHWSNVDDLPEMFNSDPIGAPPGYPNEWVIDLIKVACIMRLADATQIDARRADPLHTPHRNPQGVSRDHWLFQERMLTPQSIAGRLVYTAAAPVEYDDAEAWWLAYDSARMIDDELRKVDALCGDLSKPRFTVSSVAGVESPERFAKFVPVSGWRPIDARPHISDSNSVIARLGGSYLYGNRAVDRISSVRELIANAIDATRARRAGAGADGIKPVQIRLEETSDADYLVVRDFGIGMSEQDLINNLCNFGHSGWRSNRISKLFPGLRINGFDPTGQFGIGFFSVFMLSDEVQIITRALQAGWKDTFVLEFSNGPASRPVLKYADHGERLSDAGTIVKVKLKTRFTEKGGLFENTPKADLASNVKLREIVRELALMSDEDVEVCAIRQDAAQLAVARNEWHEMTGEELFDSRNYHLSRYVPADAISIMRKAFAHGLASVKNSDGEVVGRLGLNVPAKELREHYMWMDRGGVYCGGLIANSFDTYCGVVKGTPTRARRDQTKVNLTLEDMQQWFQSQLALLDFASIGDEEAWLLQDAGLVLGIRSEQLPIVYGENGFITPAEFRATCSELNEIYLIDEFPEKLDIDGSRHLGFRAKYYGNHSFCVLSGNQFLLSCNSRIYDPDVGAFPTRKNEYENEFKDHSRKDRGFDPIHWWGHSFAGCDGELIRLLGEAWNTSPTGLIKNMSMCEFRPSESIDSRVEAQCVGGGLTKVDALRIVRN